MKERNTARRKNQRQTEQKDTEKSEKIFFRVRGPGLSFGPPKFFAIENLGSVYTQVGTPGYDRGTAVV